MQKSVAFDKRLTLNLNLAEDIPPLLLEDQLKIKQVLLNLLGNAIKFTEQGILRKMTPSVENTEEPVSVTGVSREEIEAL